MHAQTNGRTDRRTHNGHNAMTIARWPLASGAKKSGLVWERVNSDLDAGLEMIQMRLIKKNTCAFY